MSVWRSFVSSRLVSRVLGRCRTHNCLLWSEYESLTEAGPGSIVPICKWTAARCHPQTARLRRSKCPYVHMLVSSHRDLSLSIGFTTSWLQQERSGTRERTNLAALYFRLSFILPTDFLCISFRSLRAANMQKCCKIERERERDTEKEDERVRGWEAE